MYSHSPKPPATRSQPSANSARTVLRAPGPPGPDPAQKIIFGVPMCAHVYRSTLRCPLPRAIQSPKISFPVRFGSVWFGLVRFGRSVTPPSLRTPKISFFVHGCPPMSTDVHRCPRQCLSGPLPRSIEFGKISFLVRFGAVWCTPAFSAGPELSSRADSLAPIGMKPGSI